MIDLIGTEVSYIIGVPSIKALVLGVVGDNYVLKHKYITQNTDGKWVYVEKEMYREKNFIESYWINTFGDSSFGDDDE